jgi:hypothetical protein
VRNPRRERRRRIDPAELWEPLEPLHGKHSHAADKPGAERDLFAEQLARDLGFPDPEATAREWAERRRQLAQLAQKTTADDSLDAADQPRVPPGSGYRMATEAENEAARAQLREGNRRAQEAIERRGGFASLRERVMAKTSRARAYLAGEPSQDPNPEHQAHADQGREEAAPAREGGRPATDTPGAD